MSPYDLDPTKSNIDTLIQVSGDIFTTCKQHRDLYATSISPTSISAIAAKYHFLAGAAETIIGIGSALYQHIDLNEIRSLYGELASNPAPHIRPVLSARISELHRCLRLAQEAFLVTRGFVDSAQPEHYLFYLLLKAKNDINRLIADLKTYYDTDNRYFGEIAACIESRLLASAADIGETPFFASVKDKQGTAPKYKILPIEQLFRHIASIWDESDNASWGHSYLQTYGQSSNHIHFSISFHDYPPTYEDYVVPLRQVLSLSMHTLYTVTKCAPELSFRTRKAFSTATRGMSQFHRKMLYDVKHRDAEPGDVVVIERVTVGEVVCVEHRSRMSVFLVRVFDINGVRGEAPDEFPAPCVRVTHRYSEYKNDVIRQLASRLATTPDSIPDAIAQQYHSTLVVRHMLGIHRVEPQFSIDPARGAPELHAYIFRIPSYHTFGRTLLRPRPN